MTQISFLPRQIQIIVHKDDRIIAFLQMFINGDDGVIYGLQGKGVFEALNRHRNAIFSTCQIKTIHAVMEPQIAQLMASKLGDVCQITEEGILEWDNKKMVKLKITKIQ